MENKNIKTIEVYAKEVKKDKQSFIACTANINNRWYKIKFNKDCNEWAKEKGIYELVVDIDNISMERGKEIENSKGKKVMQNDTLWIKSVISLTHYTEEQMRERNRVTMNSVFGD